jgi:OmpA-OmpF porin, OOP family
LLLLNRDNITNQFSFMKGDIMPKQMLKLMPVLMVCALLLSCSTAPPLGDYDSMHDGAGYYVQKVDNFLVILDASYSMDESYMDNKKLTLARDTISRMNRSIPPLDFQGGLRSFGGAQCPFKQQTELIYGVGNYNGEAFEQALAMVNQAGGPSPLSSALKAAEADLSQTAGPMALLVFSDGKEIDNAPVSVASALKEKYGQRLCIYTIQIGNDAKGAELLKAVAEAGGCGFMVQADDLAGQGQMTDFVKEVFLTHRPDTDGDGVYDDMDKCPGTPAGVKVDADGCPLDSDGDGVYDDMDKCPGTPMGVTVDADGCPLDSDGDGVYDDLDKCPETPQNVTVDADGCPLDSDNDGVYNYKDKCPNTPEGARVNAVGCWTLGDVLFDTDKSNIKPLMAHILNEVVDVLNSNPGMKLEVQGHTDSRGTKTYNQTLSEKRADSVKRYLVEKGIAPSRLTSIGYGETLPMDSNDTDEGMANNRRVELTPSF